MKTHRRTLGLLLFISGIAGVYLTSQWAYNIWGQSWIHTAHSTLLYLLSALDIGLLILGLTFIALECKKEG